MPARKLRAELVPAAVRLEAAAEGVRVAPHLVGGDPTFRYPKPQLVGLPPPPSFRLALTDGALDAGIGLAFRASEVEAPLVEFAPWLHRLHLVG